MRWYSAIGTPSRLGFGIAILAATCVLVLCAVFQFVMPVQNLAGGPYLGTQNANFRGIILYASAGGSHILLCTSIILALYSTLKSYEPHFEFLKTRRSVFIAFFVIALAVCVACLLDLSIVERSYHETTRPIESDPRFGFLLQNISLWRFQIQIFALFPLSLVLFAVAAAVLACFWVAQHAIHVSLHNSIGAVEANELKREAARLLFFVSVIFTSSTIATVTFLQIGRDWIAKGPEREAYVQNGYAMSIFWSVCFTSIIIVIILTPTVWAMAAMGRRGHESIVRDGKAGFYDRIYETISYKFSSQVAATILMPLFTSSIAALFGS